MIRVFWSDDGHNWNHYGDFTPEEGVEMRAAIRALRADGSYVNIL